MTCPTCGCEPSEEAMENPENIWCVVCGFSGHPIEWLDDDPDPQETV